MLLAPDDIAALRDDLGRFRQDLSEAAKRLADRRELVLTASPVVDVAADPTRPRGWPFVLTVTGRQTVAVEPGPGANTARTPVAVLRPVRGSDSTFTIQRGRPNRVGSSSLVDCVADHALVSRFHCELAYQAGGWVVYERVPSRNGTWVNENRGVGTHLVGSWAVIDLARAVQFRLDDISTAPTATNPAV